MNTLITKYRKNVAFQYATTCFDPPPFPHGDMILKHLPQTHFDVFSIELPESGSNIQDDNYCFWHCCSDLQIKNLFALDCDTWGGCKRYPVAIFNRSWTCFELHVDISYTYEVMRLKIVKKKKKKTNAKFKRHLCSLNIFCYKPS